MMSTRQRRHSWLPRLGRRLLGDRGSLLVDAMVGILVTALALTAVVYALGAAATATSYNTANTARFNWMQSYVNDLGTNPLAVSTTASTSTQTVNGRTLPVTVWRQDVDSQSTVLYAAAAKPGSETKVDCTNPSTAATNGCLTVQVSVPLDATGISTVSVNPSWTNAGVATSAGATVAGPSVGTFTAPAGASSVRFVFSLSGAASAAVITFTDGAGRQLQSIDFDSTTNQYFYGSLPLYGNQNVTIQIGTSATLSNFYIYRAAS